jgi:hypothetical protein
LCGIEARRMEHEERELSRESSSNGEHEEKKDASSLFPSSSPPIPPYPPPPPPRPSSSLSAVPFSAPAPSLFSKLSSALNLSPEYSYSEMLDQCSFCTHQLNESANSPLMDFHLPCGHTICSKCMADSSHELGVKLESISQIIAIDSAVNDYDGLQKLFYQCPVCQISLILVPKQEDRNSALTETRSTSLCSQFPDLPTICTHEEDRPLEVTDTSENDPPSYTTIPIEAATPTPVCSNHGESIKWFCSTCNKVTCDECLSEGSHRNHEFKLCYSVAPLLRSHLKDTLDRVRNKRDSVVMRLGVLESRGDQGSYIGPREAIARHCSELRAAVDELESRLLRDVNFFMRDAVGVASLRDELTDLDDFEDRCGSYESYNAVELCVLMSTLARYESNLQLSFKASGKSTKEIDLERGEVSICASVEEKLGLKLQMSPKILEGIRDSGTVHITRQPSAYDVRENSYCLS